MTRGEARQRPYHLELPDSMFMTLYPDGSYDGPWNPAHATVLEDGSVWLGDNWGQQTNRIYRIISQDGKRVVEEQAGEMILQPVEWSSEDERWVDV